MHHIHFHMKKWESFVKETRLPYTCVHFLFKGFCRLLIQCVQRIVVKVCLSSWIIYENGVSIKFSTCQRQCVLKLYDISVQALPFASIHMTHKFEYSFIFPPLPHWVFYTVCACVCSMSEVLKLKNKTTCIETCNTISSYIDIKIFL